MNQIYGFEGEVKAKYTAQMYELFSEVFEWLPLAQCINGKVLVRTAASPHGPLLYLPRVGRCAGEEVKGVGGGIQLAPPPHTAVPTLNSRSCMGAYSVRTASPWTISGRSNGIGSPQIQVTGWAGDSPFLPGASACPGLGSDCGQGPALGEDSKTASASFLQRGSVHLPPLLAREHSCPGCRAHFSH